MAKKYRVKPFFGTMTSYSKYYVIQVLTIFGFWRTISQETADKDKIMKDCEEAQDLYDKYYD
jgi:hypothetical protein